MAVNITQFGRVEFDPMSVPSANFAGDREGAPTEFQRELQSAQRNDRDNEPSASQRSGETTEAPTQAEAPPTAEQPPQPEEVRQGQPEGDEESSQLSTVTDAPRRAVELTDSDRTHEGGVPASREIAGKGAGTSPSSLQPTLAHLADAEAAAAQSKGQATTFAVTAPGQAAPQTATATGADAIPATRNAVGATEKASAPAATTGYRSLNAATLRMAEDARDSIFRQIAMRLMPDGGEMRVLVDPPQLGELEMRMVVEGDSLRLSVVAERPEVAVMMQKHIAELRQHLEAQGLTVTDTDIRSRDPQAEGSDDANRDARNQHNDGPSAGDETEQTRPMEFAPRGFITADGLDFWI